MLLVWFGGPRPDYQDLEPTPSAIKFNIADLDALINEREKNTVNLKEDNEERIIWNDSVGVQTDYSIVYLPGFTATYFEASPLPDSIAQRFGMNLFYARIFGHGIEDVDAFKGVEPMQFLESAKEAISIGKSLGKKLIVMACSTGATYATYLAAHDPEIEALILLSPNFMLYDPNAKFADGPWGKQLLTKMFDGEYRAVDFPEIMKKYWTPRYHIDAVIALEYLLENTMTEDVYKKVDQALFLACYYKNEEEQDKVVSVKEMRNMFAHVSTDPERKVFEEFPDAENHIIACPAVSKDVEGVRLAVEKFIEEKIFD